MLSISALIDFLMDLLRSDEAMAEFEADPQAALAAAGLEGVSAQDVRDAATVIADQDGVRCGSNDDEDHGPSRSSHHGDDDGSRSHHDDGDDPVREIHHVTNTYEVDDDVTVEDSFNSYNEYNVSYVDNSTNVVNIDDRDTLIVGEEVNVEGSFNGDSSANLAQDSFNSDDDTLVEDSFNETDVTAINDESTTVNDSFNEVENDVIAIDEGSNNTIVQSSDIEDSAPADTGTSDDLAAADAAETAAVGA